MGGFLPQCVFPAESGDPMRIVVVGRAPQGQPMPVLAPVLRFPRASGPAAPRAMGCSRHDADKTGPLSQRYLHFHSNTVTLSTPLRLQNSPLRPPEGERLPFETPPRTQNSPNATQRARSPPRAQHRAQHHPRSAPPRGPLPCPWPQDCHHALDRHGQRRALPIPWPPGPPQYRATAA